MKIIRKNSITKFYGLSEHKQHKQQVQLIDLLDLFTYVAGSDIDCIFNELSGKSETITLESESGKTTTIEGLDLAAPRKVMSYSRGRLWLETLSNSRSLQLVETISSIIAKHSCNAMLKPDFEMEVHIIGVTLAENNNEIVEKYKW